MVDSPAFVSKSAPSSAGKGDTGGEGFFWDGTMLRPPSSPTDEDSITKAFKMISTNSLPEISRASAAAEIKINVFYVPVLVKENVLRPFISVAEVILF